MVLFDELQGLLGIEQYRDLEERFGVGSGGEEEREERK